MALTKPPVLPPWAEAGDKVQPTNAEIQTGWPLSNTPPARQRWNWILNFLANGVRYLTRRGLSDYGADETYMVGDRVIGDDGKTYRSIQDNNINHAPSASPLWWEEWAPSLSRLADLLQKQTYTAFTTAGAAPNFTLTPAPAITAYTAGQRFRVKFHAAGSGADVLNISGLGNKSLKQYDNTGAKVAAAIVGNMLTDVEYDGVDIVVIDPLPSGQAYDTFPFAALPFPTIATSTNRLTLTPAAVAGQGGTVSVPAGVNIALCEAVTGSTGRKRAFVTPAWTSGNLAINSTYFLRAQVIAGALTFYTQNGTDTDATPGTLVGTVDGASGGGFDSTCLDMLVAKVVTGTAGTTPTVTALANAEYLYARSAEMTVSAVAGPNTAGTLSTATGAESWVNLRFETLNWGRKPKFGLAQTGQLSFVSYEMNYLMLPQTYNRYRVLGTYSGSPNFTPGDGVYTYLEAFA